MRHRISHMAAVIGTTLAIVAGAAPVTAVAATFDYPASNEGSAYSSLKEAIDAAEDGDTIHLTADVDLGGDEIILRKAVTIDMAGHSITGTAAAGDDLFWVPDGKLTLTGWGTVSATGGNQVAFLGSKSVGGGELTVGGGVTIKGPALGVGIVNNSKLDVAGTIETGATSITGNGSEGQGGTAITIREGASVTNTGEGGVAIYHPQDGTLDVWGSVTAETAIYAKSGTVTVHRGATVRGTGEKAAYQQEGSGCDATGDAIVLENNASYANAPILNVEGGTVESANGAAVAGYNASNVDPDTPLNQRTDDDGNVTTGAVTGGTFSDDSFVPWCAEGFKASQNDDGTWSPAGPPVCQIGDTTYRSLRDAVWAAEDGDTIRLTADVDLDDGIPLWGRAVTIDMAGHSITDTASSSGELFYLDGGKLTLAGEGTVSVTGSRMVAYISSGGSELTVGEGVTIKSLRGGVMIFGDSKLDVAGTIETGSTSIIGSGSEGQGGTAITIREGASVTNTGKDGVAIYHPQDGTLDVWGSVTAETAIYAKSGTVTVHEGATVRGTGEKAAYQQEYYDGCHATGDAIVLENDASYANAPILNVEGGTVESANGAAVAGYNASNVDADTPFNQRTDDDGNVTTGAVTGGTFSDDSFAPWCAEGFKPVKNDDGTWSPAEFKSVWSRVFGRNAYDTMQQCVQADGVFADGRGGTVVVATGDGYWDALAASGLAGCEDAPIVTTTKGKLAPQAQAELQRLKPSKVVVMGGTFAVSDAAYAQIQQACPGAEVSRVFGDRADDTAVEAYKAGSGWGDTCVVATIDGYWDALSIAPYAYARRAPIFLTNMGSKQLSTATLKAIRAGGFRHVVIVGGTGAVPAAVEGQLAGFKVTRLCGKSAIDTSAEIAKWEVSEQGMVTANMAVATGQGYWDALAGAPLVGKQNSVLVLVNENKYQAIDAVYEAGDGKVSSGYVLGGTMAVSDKTMGHLG